VEPDSEIKLVRVVEYHTLYGVDRTRLTTCTRLPLTVLGKDSQYGKDRVWNVL